MVEPVVVIAVGIVVVNEIYYGGVKNEYQSRHNGSGI